MVLVIFGLGFHDVQNNGHSVFIVVSDNTLIRIGAIPSNEPVSFVRKLGVLIIW